MTISSIGTSDLSQNTSDKSSTPTANDIQRVRDFLVQLQANICQALEQQAKRARLRRWGERSLDVDILLYGDIEISEPQLTIPHAGLHERNFVLLPLRELAPELIILNKPITDYPSSDDWTGLKLLKLN